MPSLEDQPAAFWPFTLTFNSRWAMVMTHTHAECQGQRSLVSKVRFSAAKLLLTAIRWPLPSRAGPQPDSCRLVHVLMNAHSRAGIGDQTPRRPVYTDSVVETPLGRLLLGISPNYIRSICCEQNLALVTALVDISTNFSSNYCLCAFNFFCERVVNVWNSLPDNVSFDSFYRFRRCIMCTNLSGHLRNCSNWLLFLF